jgi:hypothetical protein
MDSLDWSALFGFLWILLAGVPSVILVHIYDIDSPHLERLIYFGFLALPLVLLCLAVGLCHFFSWVTNWAIDVSNHLYSTLIPSPRLGWRSLRGYADLGTPLLSGTECPHTCQTTSKLCQECFQIVENSRLISGTFYIFTPHTEWHKWDIPVRGSEFTASRRSCQLCHILWNSLHERTRIRLTHTIPRRDLADASWLWVSIWKDEIGRCYMSLFDEPWPWYASRPENRHNLCKAIEITEGSSTSRDSCSWVADFYRVPQRSISNCSHPDLDR